MSFTPHTHIKISDMAEAEKLRSKLIKFLWKQKGLPSATPKLKQKNYQNDRFHKMDSLRKVDEFILKMEYNVNSLSYLYTPKGKSNKKLIIYHHGHSGSGDSDFGKKVINFFLSKGYHVMGFAMPLSWPNNQPKIKGSGYGGDLVGHNLLKTMETKEFCPLKFFIEPVCASLNLLDKSYKFNSYYMVGLSGGGLTTMLCSAIDSRISHGYNVAGGIPVQLRTRGQDRGDYEQIHSGFYGVASYLDLYILGAIGKGRKCVQVYNKFDSCCFAGEPHLKWEPAVQKVVRKLDGYYKVYLDTSHRSHMISKWALKNILKEIEK